jgi:transcriptional regulator GlxA family with amidase domain
MSYGTNGHLIKTLAMIDQGGILAHLHGPNENKPKYQQQPAPAKQSQNRKLADWQIQRVRHYVSDNLGSKLRIDDIACQIRLSKSYFSRAFKDVMGISCSAYIIRLRLEKAKYLLIATRTPIAEIAIECGLADQSHLTRLFSQLIGLPPGAWRRQYFEKAENRLLDRQPVVEAA